MKLEKLLRRTLLEHFHNIERYAHATIQDPSQSENLHQFRVNTRRVRSILKEFKECFETSYLKKSKLLVRFIEESNEARDLDVFLERIESVELPHEMEVGRGELLRVVRARREEAYERLFGFLVRVPAMLFGIKDPGVKKCAKKADKALRKHLKKRLKRLEKLGHTIRSDEEFHSLRIALKQVRYVAELMVRNRMMSKRRLKRLKRLQDLFGGVQDATVEVQMLHSIAKSYFFETQTLFVMGKMVGDLMQKKKKLKKRLKKELKRELKRPLF